MHVCMVMSAWLIVLMYARLPVWLYVCMYVCMHENIDVWFNVRMPSDMYVCMYGWMHARVLVYTLFVYV